MEDEQLYEQRGVSIKSEREEVRATSAALCHVHKLKNKKNKESHSEFDTIGFDHENWNLMLHMVFGVSKSVRNSAIEEAFELKEEDFHRKYGYELIS